jgi:RNA polymerase sigma factor for flagellar operon FliA
MITENPNATATALYGPSAERERLLLENLTEVRYIARRIHDRLPSHVFFDDLVHSGILGLIDAVDRFDPGKNVQLKSYARFRIRGAILDSLRQMDWSPRNLRRQARRIEEARRDLTAQFGRAPFEPEMAAHLAMPVEQFQHLLGELRGLDLSSLQALSDDGTIAESASVVGSRSEDDPFQRTFRAEVRAMLADAIDKLGEKGRKVLSLYYLEELTMKQVGVIMNIGESRVSQIHTSVLIALRSSIRGRLASSPSPSAKAQSAKTQSLDAPLPVVPSGARGNPLRE